MQTTIFEPIPDVGPSVTRRVELDGKFLSAGGQRFLIKGVTYGTFAPDAEGRQFPPLARVAKDFAAMADAGVNTVRVYTAPSLQLLDEAARHGLRVMVGLPWSQHVAFLNDRTLLRQIRHELSSSVRVIGAHPATLLVALGNEIPAAVVRWHGARAIERFLLELFQDAKGASPDTLLTYVNFPPTEFLELPFLDLCAFNVYLHSSDELRAYLARLQNVAIDKPLLLAEVGADSVREGLEGQATLTAAAIRSGFAEGACGVVAFAWTDEWWRGGSIVDDWRFGLVDAQRRPKPALAAVAQAFAEAPFAAAARQSWPRVSVVVCAYNAADTLDDCLRSLLQLTYPDVEILVVNDGSTDGTASVLERYPSVTVVTVPNGGLSAARNVGLHTATGAIVAYTDADVRVDPDWLTYLVQPLLTGDAKAVGGPNVVPEDDPWVSQCIALAPGGPTHVLLDDRVAEHVPGCNMAFARDALVALGGFNPIYLRAGDDVDICWRLQARGWTIAFAPAALVWHHHRTSVGAYWRQQVGYGEGEAWLEPHHPEKFLGRHMRWRGRIYSRLPWVRSLKASRVNTGVWGSSAFPSVYYTDANPWVHLPHTKRWQIGSVLMALAGTQTTAHPPYQGVGAALVVLGVVGVLTTLGACLAHACASDLRRLGVAESAPAARVWRYRLFIAWLHLIQPIARRWGRIRGALSPPTMQQPRAAVTTPAWTIMGRERLQRVFALVFSRGRDQAYWSERWLSAERVLSQCTAALALAWTVDAITVDDGWSPDLDISVAAMCWAALDVRVLVEEHSQGRCLLRIATRLRLSLRMIGIFVFSGVLLPAGLTLWSPLQWAGLWAPVVAIGVAGALFEFWRLARAVTAIDRVLSSVMNTLGTTLVPSPPSGSSPYAASVS